ncbi:MAG TPA: hypothetical protein EYN96_05345 [Candidatus Hydrogenedentes bacterium]|nr:hypothetical protein [Candidatus Hydrogenedentota bacterium]
MNMRSDFKSAEKYFKQAAKIFHARYGENHQHTRAAVRNWQSASAQLKKPNPS